jgi:hypothetical protein
MFCQLVSTAHFRLIETFKIMFHHSELSPPARRANRKEYVSLKKIRLLPISGINIKDINFKVLKYDGAWVMIYMAKCHASPIEAFNRGSIKKPNLQIESSAFFCSSKGLLELARVKSLLEHDH